MTAINTIYKALSKIHQISQQVFDNFEKISDVVFSYFFTGESNTKD